MAGETIDLSELMRKAQSGDEAAYRELLSQARKVAVGFAKKRVRDHQAVEEIAQNVLLKLHVSRHTYDVALPFKPWLFAIIRSTFSDFFRSEKARGLIHFVESVSDDQGEHADAEARLEIAEAFEQLSPDQQQAFELVKVRGMTMEEASRATGVSVAAMKVRAHRAYKIFKAAMGDKASDSDD